MTGKATNDFSTDPLLLRLCVERFEKHFSLAKSPGVSVGFNEGSEAPATSVLSSMNFQRKVTFAQIKLDCPPPPSWAAAGTNITQVVEGGDSVTDTD